MAYNAAQLYQILLQGGWPNDPTLLANMVAIGLAESSGNPDALNHTSREYSRGLWQINLNAHPEYSDTAMRDPVMNAAAAYDVYQRQGLRAWGAYTDGRYRPYLNAANQAATGAGGNDGTWIATDDGNGDYFGIPDLNAYDFGENQGGGDGTWQLAQTAAPVPVAQQAGIGAVGIIAIAVFGYFAGRQIGLI